MVARRATDIVIRQENQEWVSHENTHCRLDPMAQAELDDVEKLKQVIAKVSNRY